VQREDTGARVEVNSAYERPRRVDIAVTVQRYAFALVITRTAHLPGPNQVLTLHWHDLQQ
jgi:hypothetical protein